MIKTKCILFKVKQIPVKKAARLNSKLLKIFEIKKLYNLFIFIQEEKI